MNSMTGFGRGLAPLAGEAQLCVELNSVNKRNLETPVSMPREWTELERGVQTELRQRFQRGRIHVLVQIVPGKESVGLSWDNAAVAASLGRLQALAKASALPFQPDAHTLVTLALHHREEAALPSVNDAEPVLRQALAGGMDELAAMRAREGAALAADLTTRLDTLQTAWQSIRQESAQAVPDYREALMQRLRQARLELDLGDGRVLREIALFADRTDVSEELIRLESHYTQFRETMSESGSIGRKLDFLTQEILRELNTVGSKTTVLAVTRHVIDSKNELERVREQVQNVE